MSMYTSLTGLNAAQTDLSVISNNVANVGTVGFKRSRAEFGDIIATSPLQNPSRVYGSGAGLKAVTQQFSQGAIEASLNVLDMAISGQGFFTVKSKAGSTDLQFSRDGSFTVDSDRYVVDSTGNALQVYPVNEQGRVLANGLANTQSLRLPLTSGLPHASTGINVQDNLPSDAAVIPSNARYTVANPYVFNKSDPLTYNSSTSLPVYDSTGNSHLATIYYVRTAAASGSGTSSTWAAHVFVDDTELVPASGANPTTLTFDTSGKITAPTGAIAFNPVSVSGSDPLTLTINHGTATTQVSDPFSVGQLTQDGFPSGRLDSVSVGTDGVVRASFTNGQSDALGKIVLANFADVNGLKQNGNAHYSATGLSGEPILGGAGSEGLGSILSGSLERSNVDITEELVNLITAQRNFQANAKAIETDSAMTSAIINIRS